METLAPTFTVSRNDGAREVHWSAAGLWTDGKVAELQGALFQAAKPFIDDAKGFRVLGDLREFAVQPRDLAEKMRLSQENSARVGVTRMALLVSSTLVKQQFRRVSAALECQFFSEKAAALAWLRG